jgi:hypothetical protein
MVTLGVSLKTVSHQLAWKDSYQPSELPTPRSQVSTLVHRIQPLLFPSLYSSSHPQLPRLHFAWTFSLIFHRTAIDLYKWRCRDTVKQARMHYLPTTDNAYHSLGTLIVLFGQASSSDDYLLLLAKCLEIVCKFSASGPSLNGDLKIRLQLRPLTIDIEPGQRNRRQG